MKSWYDLSKHPFLQRHGRTAFLNPFYISIAVFLLMACSFLSPSVSNNNPAPPQPERTSNPAETQVNISPSPIPNITATSLEAAALSTEELDQIIPDLWKVTGVPNEVALPQELCKLDCYQKAWDAGKSFLLLELIKLENSDIAEREIQVDMKIAQETLGLKPKYLPRAEYLPEHTWLGVDSQVDKTVFYLLTQEQDYYLRIWLYLFDGPLQEDDQLLQIRMEFLISGKQWKKLFDLGYVDHVSFTPLKSDETMP